MSAYEGASQGHAFWPQPLTSKIGRWMSEGEEREISMVQATPTVQRYD